MNAPTQRVNAFGAQFYKTITVAICSTCYDCLQEPVGLRINLLQICLGGSYFAQTNFRYDSLSPTDS
jgi:hypothetical protein